MDIPVQMGFSTTILIIDLLYPCFLLGCDRYHDIMIRILRLWKPVGSHANSACIAATNMWLHWSQLICNPGRCRDNPTWKLTQTKQRQRQLPFKPRRMFSINQYIISDLAFIQVISLHILPTLWKHIRAIIKPSTQADIYYLDESTIFAIWYKHGCRQLFQPQYLEY